MNCFPGASPALLGCPIYQTRPTILDCRCFPGHTGHEARIPRERANNVHFGFLFCSHLLRQPLGNHLSLKQINFDACTLNSFCKNCKISSSLALQKKLGSYSRKSLGLFHFSAHSSGENRNYFTEQHCRNLGFLQSCVRRNRDILQAGVAVTCSHLAKRLQMENQNAHLLRSQ